MHDHSNPQSSAQTTYNTRYQEIKKVTLIGSVIDLLLGVAKIFVGLLTKSQVLVADGIHSLSDLATDFVVIFAAKQANREADENHPYGHERIETLSTVVLGIALMVVAVGICYEAVIKIMAIQAGQTYPIPTYLALAIAILSIVLKEAIYHYTMHYAKKLRSKMLEANAWHSRTDSISSVVAVIGILGAMAGYDYVDPLAAIIVALIIFHIGWKFTWASVLELVDTGLEPKQIEEINQVINEVSGVKDMHYLRTRMMGSEALVDVHIQVAPEVSVSEGHQISETVRYRIIKNIDGIKDVMVHIDPEDDQDDMASYSKLPLRDKLLAELQQQWQTIPASTQIKKITLHYLDGKIIVDVFIPLETCTDLNQLATLSEQLKKAGTEHPNISQVRVNYTA